MTLDARLVVMGVSGAGKSTIGAATAREAGVRFVDADDLHPAGNIAKMAAGIPLTDADRWPWLRLVGTELAAAPSVIACSALRRAYRDAIRAVVPAAHFVLLHLSGEDAHTRASNRPDHFMPASLVASQLQLLEPLAPDEHGITVDSTRPVPEIVDLILGFTSHASSVSRPNSRQ